MKKEKDLLNTKKTKIMVVDRDNNINNTDFTIAGNKIEVVNQFEYLGSIMNNKGESTTEIRRRLAMARSTVQSMSHIWKSRSRPLSQSEGSSASCNFILYCDIRK